MARADQQTPLVGRARELGVLLAALQRAAEARPGAVLVAGDAGVGKTRLVGELVDRAAEQGATVLLGHCLDLGDVGLPYLPFTEALATLDATPGGPAGGDGTAADERAGDMVMSRLPWEGRGGPRGDVDQLRLFDAVSHALHEAGRRGPGPVLLVLEDLHWADRSSRDLLAFLLGRLRDARVLVVASYRTDDLHRRHPLRPLLGQLVRSPAVERVDLTAFDGAEMAEYLRSLSGGSVPEPLVQEILERSEGNAFYARELLESASTSSGGVGLSPALADVLLHRVEQLSEPAEAVVRALSVGGPRVGHDLLAQVTGLPEDDLELAVREAVTHHVLAPSGPQHYAFGHMLLAEAVQADLLPGERVRLHAAYARAIEEGGATGRPVGSAAALAHHRRESHDVPGALSASVQAAAEAEELSAPAEAWQHLERTLQLWSAVPDAEERAGRDVVAVSLAAASAASRAGALPRAVALAEEAVARLPPDADLKRAADVRRALAVHLLNADRAEAALEAATLAMQVAARAGPAAAPIGAWAAATAAHALRGLDRDDEARALAERARDQARAAGSASAEADALVTLSALVRGGPGGASAELLRQAQERARAAGDDLVEVRVGYALAGDRYEAGDVLGALAVIEPEVQRAGRTGLTWSPYGLELRALQVTVLFVAGDWAGSIRAARLVRPLPPDAAAARLAAASLNALVASGDAAAGDLVEQLDGAWHHDPMIALLAGGCGSELQRWSGDPAAALATVQRAVSFLIDAWEPWFLGAIWLAAVGLAAAGDMAEAARLVRDEATEERVRAEGRALLDRARQTAEQGHPRGGVLGPEGQAWLLRAEAEHSRVAGVADVELWQRCVEAYGYGHGYEQARCRWRRAEALLATGRREEAAASAQEAHRAALALGAAPLAAALEALARRGHLALGGSERVDRTSPLTARESEVLALLAEGRTNRQIGERLFMAEKTASVHVSRILAKLGVASRTEAVSRAHQDGLLG